MKRMDASFETQAPLSADLQWMLQSRQASDASLCRTLLNEYAPRLYALGRAVYTDPQRAGRFVMQGLIRSVLQRDRYRPPASIHAWVYRQALQAGQLSALQADRISLLYGVHGLSPAEIAEALGQPAERILLEIERLPVGPPPPAEVFEPLPEETLLEWQMQIMEKISVERWRLQWRGHLLEFALIGLVLLTAFALGRFSNWLWPEPAGLPLRSPTPVVARFFQYTVKPGDTLDTLASKLAVEAEQIADANALRPQAALVPGQMLMLPSGFARGWLATPVPPVRLPAPEELGSDPSVEAILQRAQESLQHWQVLWADVAFIHYGPPGYVGPPQSITRKQLWIVQPDDLRVIYGPWGQAPEGSYVIAGGHAYARDFAAGKLFEDLPSEMLIDYDLKKLFLSQTPALYNGEFRRVGRGEVAGRPAWIVDWMSPGGGRVYRFWVDAAYGMILHRREYGGRGFDVALEDVSVSAVSFQGAFFPQVFDPFAFLGDHFAAGPSGDAQAAQASWAPPTWAGATGHEPLEHTLPPPGFDPADSRLTFDHSTSETGVSLFAADYYLGSIPLISPSILSCERSTDGHILVFANLADLQVSLYWIDLAAPQALHTVFSQGSTSNDFALSPESRKLAFFGCPAPSTDCGVYLLDLESGSYRELLPSTVAHYFRWKPDNSQLAWLNAADAAHNWQFLVVDAGDGTVRYRGEFDWSRIAPAPGSPADSWGAPARPRRGGLEGCVDPLRVGPTPTR